MLTWIRLGTEKIYGCGTTEFAVGMSYKGLNPTTEVDIYYKIVDYIIHHGPRPAR